MDYLKLIGILIIVCGFLFKIDTFATVVIAGLATALVSGVDFFSFLEELGKNFTAQRLTTLFIITLPLIGLTETFGLRHRAIYFIEKLKGMTTGSFFTVYLLIRELCGLVSIRIGGHPQFVRPIVEPMGQAAAQTKLGELTAKEVEAIKARAAATENLGNFFAQNTFLGSAGVLLIAGTLEQAGYVSDQAGIAAASIPIAIITFIVSAIYNYVFDKKMQKNHKQ